MVLSPVEIVLGALVVVLAAVAIYFFMQNRRTRALRSRFGSEYAHTVREVGDERKAQAVLEQRAKRVAQYTIRPLPAGRREGFIQEWRAVQALFVDDPRAAVGRADGLLGQVMEARGYPVTDFEQAAQDLSVDHPEVVQNYRAGHEIALRHRDGDADTENMRQAMIHYRALFDDLVNEPHPDDVRAAAAPRVQSRG